MFSEGRLGGGSVLPLMDEIERTLLSHRAADGAAPLRAVLRRRDIYHGPHARVAPHLVAVPALGWGIAGSERAGLRRPLVERPAAHVEGTHQHDLAFVLGAPSVAGAGPTLEDLGATVLDHLGLYAEDVDGAPLAA
jgi:hypothetical protein